MNKVKLECFCSSLQGELNVISNKKSFHVHCLCTDCQDFAGYLNNKGKILDKSGGSELFQTYPAYLKITKGEENISCMQLSKKGITRWYASCCNAPIANTMASPKVPFAGVSVKLMKFSSNSEKEEILGPVIMKAYGRSALGEKPEDAHDTFPMSFMPRMLKFMFMGFICGKYKPSPFYKDGGPVSIPKINLPCKNNQ